MAYIKGKVTDLGDNPFYDEDGKVLCMIIGENGEESLEFVALDEGNSENIPQQYSQPSSTSISSTPSTSHAQDLQFLTASARARLEWSDDATRLLLNLYIKLFPQIGPLKRFKYRKDMWLYVSQQLKAILQFECTVDQCQQHYRSILRAYTDGEKKNRTSGNIREKLPWEEEIRKIRAIDDSTEPEILLGVGAKKRLKPQEDAIKKKSKINSEKIETKPEDKCIEAIFKVSKEREKKKDKRLQKKMRFMAKLYKIEISDNEIDSSTSSE